jgi:mRNA interferase RelE/StbE
MVCLFKRAFLKDLAELPTIYRKKIERLVFEEIPSLKDITGKLGIKKMQGYENYYRIRIGSYRIGCEIQAGSKIIFYRVKNRKDIYKVFP